MPRETKQTPLTLLHENRHTKKKWHTQTYVAVSEKNCRKILSIRAGNPFLHSKDSAGKHCARLSLNQILALIWLFIYGKCTIREAVEITKHSTATVVEWWHMCRRVCTATLDLQPKFVGTHESPVQIDESYFSGKRKYNRGRMMEGDHRTDFEEIGDWNSEQYDDDDEPADFGKDSSEWKWVVGIYSSSQNVRFFRVRNRKKETLMSLITKYVAPGSVISTDEFTSYKALSSLGYVHQTVNHSKNYVDPETGAHTQGIERAWVDAKRWYKRAGGSRKFLQGHLDEAAWRKLRGIGNQNRTLLESFLIDLGNSFCYVQDSL